MGWRPSLLSVVACFAAVVLPTATTVAFIQNGNSSDAEQYAVYSAYIEDGLNLESQSRASILIGEDAIFVADLNTIWRWRYSFGSILNLSRRTDSPRFSLMLKLFLENLVTHKLDRQFTLSADYQLLGAKELSLENVSSRFPRSFGYITFSSIGFDSNLTDAVFYVEHLCGLCGGGEYVLMHKSQNKWQIVSRYSTWVS